jgi:lysophospholipase L1-like esterase
LNPNQTRQTRARLFSACAKLGLGALISCNSVDRGPTAPPNPLALTSAASPFTAPAAAVSAAALIPSAPPSAPQTLLLDPAPTAAPAPLGDAGAGHQYVVAAVGDSLTDPRSHGGGYLEYLKTRCPSLEIDNFGKGATMVNQMRRSFAKQVEASPKQYTHLIVFGGVNDLYSDLTAFRTPAKIEADLSYMYAWGKAHGVQVIALTVAPWGGFTRYFNDSRAETTHELNAWIRQQGSVGKVDHVVDAYALLSCGDADSLCDRFFKPFRDGIHFGPEGHQILGQALYQGAFSDCTPSGMPKPLD